MRNYEYDEDGYVHDLNERRFVEDYYTMTPDDAYFEIEEYEEEYLRDCE